MVVLVFCVFEKRVRVTQLPFYNLTCNVLSGTLIRKYYTYPDALFWSNNSDTISVNHYYYYSYYY